MNRVFQVGKIVTAPVPQRSGSGRVPKHAGYIKSLKRGQAYVVECDAVDKRFLQSTLLGCAKRNCASTGRFVTRQTKTGVGIWRVG
jgi:hypothetical protein